MGRPAQFDRAKAVETAMNEIWKNGMEASSTKALSERLGITRSSFYNAFGSREELFKEALSLYASRSPDADLEDISSDADIPKIITDLFREVCRIRAADRQAKGCMVINSVAELVGFDDKLGPMLEEAVLKSLNRFEKLLQMAAKKGQIQTRDETREKALALQNLLIGLNLMSKVVRSEEDLWATAKHTLKSLGLYRE